MAGQVEPDEEAEVNALGRRDLVAEVLAFARVAVEEIVDAGQALKVPGGGQKEHGVAGAFGHEQPRDFEQRGHAGRVLSARGQRGDDRDGVVVCLQDDDLVAPPLDFAALAARHILGQARQNGE